MNNLVAVNSLHWQKSLLSPSSTVQTKNVFLLVFLISEIFGSNTYLINSPAKYQVPNTWNISKAYFNAISILYLFSSSNAPSIKVIIEKSRDEVSLMEQDTIENVS
jgi:hypothetical protein